jgi:hypothetical protein
VNVLQSDGVVRLQETDELPDRFPHFDLFLWCMRTSTMTRMIRLKPGQLTRLEDLEHAYIYPF